MLPDDFIFKVDTTNRLYHVIRRADMRLEARVADRPNMEPGIWSEADFAKNIGNGWTILSTNEDETEIDIQNLI